MSDLSVSTRPPDGPISDTEFVSVRARRHCTIPTSSNASSRPATIARRQSSSSVPAMSDVNCRPMPTLAASRLRKCCPGGSPMTV